MAVLGGVPLLDRITPALASPDPVTRRGALAGLLRSGELEAVDLASGPLHEMAASPDPAQRAEAARVLGAAAQAGMPRLLVLLIDDADDGVASEALRAAPSVGHEVLWPTVIAALERPPIRSAARRALTAGGAGAIDAVAAALQATPRPRPEVQIALLDAVARSGPPGVPVACGTLGPSLLDDDPGVGAAAIDALLRLGVTIDRDLRAALAAAVERDLDEIGALATDEIALTGSPLGDALADRRRRVTARLLGPGPCSVIRPRRTVSSPSSTGVACPRPIPTTAPMPSRASRPVTIGWSGAPSPG